MVAYDKSYFAGFRIASYSHTRIRKLLFSSCTITERNPRDGTEGGVSSTVENRVVSTWPGSPTGGLGYIAAIAPARASR